LVFILITCFALFFRLRNGNLNKKSWTVVVSFALLVSFILAFVSVWSVWTPNTTNWDFHGGEFNGYIPWSMLSFPLRMSVYHTPFVRLLYDGNSISGNVSFNVFLTNTKVIEFTGVFRYAPMFGKVPLLYSINFPFFNSGEAFFVFLTVFFALFNFVGALLGFVVATALKKRVPFQHTLCAE